MVPDPNIKLPDVEEERKKQKMKLDVWSGVKWWKWGDMKQWIWIKLDQRKRKQKKKQRKDRDNWNLPGYDSSRLNEGNRQEK